MNRKIRMLASVLLAFIFISGCAHFRKDCPELKRLPDEWLECNTQGTDSGKYSFSGAGENMPILRVSDAR